MKKTTQKKSGFVLVFIMFVFAVSAFALSSCNEKTNTTPIRIAICPWPGYEFLHLADKKGFFKEEGARVQLVRFSALEDARLAYERGEVDGMTSTLIELLQAHENGRDAKITLLTDFSNGADVVLARKEITDVAALKGKKIGVEADTLSAFVIARALEMKGLSLDDVQLESMSQLNMADALLDGKIDAIHSYPPYSTNLIKHAGQVNKIFDSSQIPGEIVDIVSIDPNIVAHRPNDIRALRRAWDKALAYANAHPEESNKIMGDLEGISAQDFAAALQGAKTLSLSDQSPMMAKGATLEKTLLKVNEVLHRGKPNQTPIRADDFIARSSDGQP